ncbi:Vacuolar protein sorting-associated protein [Wickerhamomyces ciferrii]|uniref:Vacuolar protein sorting-associated protein n=1 Tax=Wickerhamomyces ciferrii (strain ATCC 14091 / BCRC 22168 / CBS 111 / JCM 3599 / NBRC 0793 / NRRL Y-1031 F-60-10) TaxID=1206466 RepID=K0KD45_WICCF|nr:Vacuolar protein sorting-associated protein [Wickerhamomyces ciferrii]CCH43025.1 Vacuolar protein sorting-associated protein [Wickerhamomyces ciferrii]
MAEDGLESSHWDDVLSSNPSRFSENISSNIANELSATLSQQNLHDHENEEDEDDDNEQDEDDNAAVEDTGKWDDRSESNKQTNNNETRVETPDEDLVSGSSNPKESKDKTGLISSLTADSGKSFISESVKSPKKDGTLFTDKNKGTLDFGDDDKDETEQSTAHLTSPTKLASRRKNVYKTPRFRRNGSKTSTLKKEVESSPLDTTENSDVLGPLGITDDTESQNQDTESPADKLLRASEAPIFEINRTPLSPLKSNRSESQPSLSGVSSSSIRESSTANSEAQSSLDPQQQLEQAKIQQKKQEAEQSNINLEIVVGDPIKVGDLTSAHTAYSVRTNTDSELLRTPQTVVSRRYRDFRWLYRQLQTTHPGRIVPPPPEKQAVGRFNDDFIEARRFALERMLVKISKNPNLQTDPDFIMFLQSDRFSSEARERERAATASSTFTAHEEVDASLNSSGSGGGFLSSIGGAFSFAPKISEPDEYFKDKKSYIEALDQQLRVFLKNLETVVLQRHDLSAVTEEFSLILGTLSELEVSRSSSDLFQEFSVTQLRIKESLDRLSLQDMLTLGSTLDEYIRVVGSIRTTFSQRDRVLLQLAGSESELKKKQASFDKTFKFNRTHTEKIDVLKVELNTLEHKHNTIKTKFDEISNTIKDELASFEIEKIQDFRNSIEIFLESTIESQKEAVELWETFYEVNLAKAE